MERFRAVREALRGTRQVISSTPKETSSLALINKECRIVWEGNRFISSQKSFFECFKETPYQFLYKLETKAMLRLNAEQPLTAKCCWLLLVFECFLLRCLTG